MAKRQRISPTKTLRLLRALIDRMDLVHNSPEYQGVWTINQLHFGPYKGPTYAKEFEEAKKYIKS